MKEFNRKITRTKGNRYCTVEIKLKEGRFSICGDEGRIVTTKEAKADALEYWRSFFDENTDELFAMNKKCGKKFTTAAGAAKFVIESDGDYHGLDATEVGNKVYLMHTCGQIRETIGEFFPEVKPLFKWHLNDMKAGCEHQEALGWGHGHTVALSVGNGLTDAQRDTILGDLKKACAVKREVEFSRRWKALREKGEATRWLRSHTDIVTVDMVTHLTTTQRLYTVASSKDLKTFDRWLREDVARDIPEEKFDAAIYKDSLGAPCPTCGYKYGTEWLKRDLPPEIIELAFTVCGGPGS